MRMRGDTIIEVILAVTIFSLVAVGALTIMNKGLAMAQLSLETTLVRQQIDSQAEMLRFVSDKASGSAAMSNLWSTIRGRVISSEPTSVIGQDTCPEAGAIDRWFALRPGGPSGLEVVNQYRSDPATFAQVVDGRSEGISIQMARAVGGNAYDAYIQACWQGPGSSEPMTLGTIVRLYDPGA